MSNRRAPQRYMQIANGLAARIESTEFDTDETLPPIQTQAIEYDAAPETVRQAPLVQEPDGMVTRKQGIGTIIIARSRELSWLQLLADWQRLLTFFNYLEAQRLNAESSDGKAGLLPDEGRALQV